MWQYDPLPDLKEASLDTRPAPPSHLLYGRKRGRVVWFPAAFTDETGRSGVLSCYHTNLVLASLQVESLGGLAAQTAVQRRNGEHPTGTHREYVRRAVDLLGVLYGGVKDRTYRSWSPRRHIEQNDVVAEVNLLRDYFNLGPLK